MLAGAGPHDLVAMLNFFKSRKNPDTEIIPYACSLNAQDKWGCGKIVELTGISTTKTSVKTINNAHALSAVEFYLRYLDAWDESTATLFYFLANQFV